MARALLTDEMWERVEPCLPPTPHRRRVPGPHPIGDRQVLAGILFVLKSGLPWDELPAEMGAGSGMTCLRRLRDWQGKGVWDRVRRVLSEAFEPGEIDWRRAEVRPRTRRRPVAATGPGRDRLARPRVDRSGGSGALRDGNAYRGSRLRAVR